MMKPICIVDDNEDLQFIYRRKFEDEGFRVVSAMNGMEALELVPQEMPGVILLDVHMPKMDGVEVLRHLKADPKTKDIPVIILSNVDSDITFQEVSELGAAEYYMVKAHVTIQKVMDTAIEVMRSHEEATGSTEAGVE